MNTIIVVEFGGGAAMRSSETKIQALLRNFVRSKEQRNPPKGKRANGAPFIFLHMFNERANTLHGFSILVVYVL